MCRFLLKPRWVALTLAVLALVVMFVNLGFWQLRRLDERRLRNTIVEQRSSSDAVGLGLIVDVDDDPIAAAADHEFRAVKATGVFDREGELKLRSQVHQGEAGYHLITPLALESGGVVLVDRGWVPLLDPYSPEAAPQSEAVTVGGVVRGSKARPRFGPEDPEDSSIISRVDIPLLQRRYDEPLFPVYVQVVGESPTLPLPSELPVLDEGTHLSYAIQWFSFAIIGAVGYAALVKKSTRRTRHALDQDHGIDTSLGV